MPGLLTGGGCVMSHIEAEMHDVAVLGNIFFPFHAQFPGFFHALFPAVGHIVVILDYFGADKAFFEVGVDYTGALDRKSVV